jgi:hypothetical protein
MHRSKKLPIPSAGLLLLTLISGAALAQTKSGMMMEGCPMMSGWSMAVSILLTALLLIVLILSILALVKYLFGKKV